MAELQTLEEIRDLIHPLSHLPLYREAGKETERRLIIRDKLYFWFPLPFVREGGFYYSTKIYFGRLLTPSRKYDILGGKGGGKMKKGWSERLNEIQDELGKLVTDVQPDNDGEWEALEKMTTAHKALRSIDRTPPESATNGAIRNRRRIK